MSKFNEEGEDGTGFAHADGKGPFECSNCVHMDGEVCKHPIMISLSKEPRDRNNYPYVGPSDCCRYVKRPTTKK